jgi:hypothetical protein
MPVRLLKQQEQLAARLFLAEIHGNKLNAAFCLRRLQVDADDPEARQLR